MGDLWVFSDQKTDQILLERGPLTVFLAVKAVVGRVLRALVQKGTKFLDVPRIWKNSLEGFGTFDEVSQTWNQKCFDSACYTWDKEENYEILKWLKYDQIECTVEV